jgi:hypothetical protein
MTETLKERLDQIASTPRSGPPPDVAAAAARGRRVLRIRRATAATGSLAAVGLAAALVVAVLPEHEATAPPKPASASPRPNPLIQRAAFGWLPKGYSTVSAGLQNGQFTVGANDGQGKGDDITLTTVTGKEPPIAKLPGGHPGNRSTAPDVNGHRAYWTIKPGGPGSEQVPAEFRWEYGTGRWGLLSINDQKAAVASTIYRIAKSVIFGERPTAFPFTVKGLPAGLPVCDASVTRRPVDTTLSLGRGCRIPDLRITVSTAVSHERQNTVVPGKGAYPFKPNTRIDGHQAHDQSLVRTDSTGSFIWVFGVQGYDVRLDASAGVLNQLKSSGGLAGLFHRMTFLDSADWTVDVFR